jgi:hypothetical protein
MEVSTMVARLSAVMGTTVAVALVVVGLWCWGSAGRVLAGRDHADLARWTMRTAGIAALAGAQVLGLTFLAGGNHRRDRSRDWLRLAAGFVCTAALIGCLSLAIASK